MHGSPILEGNKRTYRICENCNEMCLCHEENCPNCNGDKIVLKTLDEIYVVAKERIRCRYRFKRLVLMNR